MSQHHMMIDIETLGTDPRSVILEAGVVIFEISHFERRELKITWSGTFTFNLFPQIQKYHRTVDPSTLDWWSKQPPESQQIIKQSLLNPDSDRHQMNQIRQLAVSCGTVWSNGNTFDPVLLQDYADQLGMGGLWKFYKNRDLRTIRRLFNRELSIPDMVTPHRAEDDAIAQTKYLSEFIARMYQRGMAVDLDEL